MRNRTIPFLAILFFSGMLLASATRFPGSDVMKFLTNPVQGDLDLGGNDIINVGSISADPAAEVLVKNDNYALSLSDTGKRIVLTGASGDKVFALPSVDVSNIGTVYTIANLDTDDRLTLATSDSDTISDSSAGGTVYNDSAQGYATITVVLLSATQWVIIGGDGTWTTT